MAGAHRRHAIIVGIILLSLLLLVRQLLGLSADRPSDQLLDTRFFVVAELGEGV